MDGFYCLEPNCGMDIVELKNTWPEMVWAGGVNGVELMERGMPEDVKREVQRHIVETDNEYDAFLHIVMEGEEPDKIPLGKLSAGESVHDIFIDEIKSRTRVAGST